MASRSWQTGLWDGWVPCNTLVHGHRSYPTCVSTATQEVQQIARVGYLVLMVHPSTPTPNKSVLPTGIVYNKYTHGHNKHA